MTDEALEVDNLIVTGELTNITEVVGRLAIMGHSVGEATITIVLTEPTTVVRAGSTLTDALRHAGLGQYAVQSFTVRVLRQGTPISN